MDDDRANPNGAPLESAARDERAAITRAESRSLTIRLMILVLTHPGNTKVWLKREKALLEALRATGWTDAPMVAKAFNIPLQTAEEVRDAVWPRIIESLRKHRVYEITRAWVMMGLRLAKSDALRQNDKFKQLPEEYHLERAFSESPSSISHTDLEAFVQHGGLTSEERIIIVGMLAGTTLTEIGKSLDLLPGSMTPRKQKIIEKLQRYFSEEI